jgi:UDP-2-acetamido-2,6-beta-L-arabino-hexul-4-ose reductase
VTAPSIAITGAAGFFGWHLRARLHALEPAAEIRVIDRTAFSDDAALESLLRGVDAVVHLAGANRGTDEAVYDTNVGLARRLVSALEATGGSPYLVYANTTHSSGDTPYGRSKQAADEALADWAHRAHAALANLCFPNLFGECGRPDYNSAVATFCRDLAEGRESAVNPDGHTELLHVQDACAVVLDAVSARFDDSRRIDGHTFAVTDVYERLRRLRDGYHGATLPQLDDRLDLRLFNALRTAMFPAHYPMPLDAHRDDRGVFVELARGHGQTQTSFSTSAPGVTRGEHYHLDKIERFVVVKGQAVMRLRRLFSDEVVSFEVSGDQPVVVDMPPLFAHNITNVGSDELLTAFWANDHFDPAAPDTFPERVEPALAEAAR